GDLAGALKEPRPAELRERVVVVAEDHQGVEVQQARQRVEAVGVVDERLAPVVLELPVGVHDLEDRRALLRGVDRAAAADDDLGVEAVEPLGLGEGDAHRAVDPLELLEPVVRPGAVVEVLLDLVPEVVEERELVAAERARVDGHAAVELLRRGRAGEAEQEEKGEKSARHTCRADGARRYHRAVGAREHGAPLSYEEATPNRIRGASYTPGHASPTPMPFGTRLRGAALLAALLLPLAAHAQLVPLAEGGARALALGRAATALEGDVWGHYNPAAWATLPGRAGAAFASQAFGLSELRIGAVAFAEPTRFGTFAATARTYGFSDFRETSL